MKLALPCAVLLAAISVHDRPAQAIAACIGDTGWSPALATVLPPHPHLAFWNSRNQGKSNFASKVTATIDDHPVEVKLVDQTAAPYQFLLVEIDSDKTGTLKIVLDGHAPVTYTIQAAGKKIEAAAATTSRAKLQLHHSTTHEAWDALAVQLDVPAVLVEAKWRRDAKADWQTITMPAMTGDQPSTLASLLDKTKPSALLGALGCYQNLTVQLLENGIDLELTAVLPDGRRVPVKGVASHFALPK